MVLTGFDWLCTAWLLSLAIDSDYLWFSVATWTLYIHCIYLSATVVIPYICVDIVGLNGTMYNSSLCKLYMEVG